MYIVLQGCFEERPHIMDLFERRSCLRKLCNTMFLFSCVIKTRCYEVKCAEDLVARLPRKRSIERLKTKALESRRTLPRLEA